MEITYSTVELATHYKGRKRPVPQWRGRWTIDGGTFSNSKMLGPAWEKRSAAPEGYLTEADARALLNEHLTALLAEANARILTDEGVKFGTVIDLYVRQKAVAIKAGKFSATTMRSYNCIIENIFRPMWGDTALKQITREDIAALHNHLAAVDEEASNIPLAGSTLNQYRAVLRGIWAVAAERCGVENISDAFVWEDIPQARSGDLSFYSPEEVLRLAAAAESPQDAAMWLTAAFTGLRAGELLALRWRAVDPRDSIIHATRSYTFETGEKLPKSYKTRSMPLMPTVASTLAQLRQRQHFTDDWDLVFPNTTGEYQDRSAMYRRFQKAARKARLHRIRFHDLRHSFGTMAIRIGTIVEVQEWMGHADIKTTRKYMHYAPRANAAAALETLVGDFPVPVLRIVD